MTNKSIKTLVVGADISPYSKLFVKQAQSLAKSLKASLVFVYVFPEANLFTPAFAHRKPYVTDFYQKAVRSFYKLPPRSKVLIRFGTPHQEIIAAAKKFKHPLIVVGHRGHNAVARFFLGSNAERVALDSPYPTWIHKGKRNTLPKNILVPSDLSAKSAKMIKFLAGLQKSLKTKSELYHVYQEPVPTLDFAAYARIYRISKGEDDRKVRTFEKSFPTLKVDTALGSINEKIKNHSEFFDLVAVSPTPRKVSRRFFGRVTETLLRSGNKSVLVLP